MSSKIQRIQSRLKSQYGLDVFHKFSTSWTKDMPQVPLPAHRIAILIGNSRALWPKFLQYLNEWNEKQLEWPSNPLDTYVRDAIETCFSSIPETLFHWANQRGVSMQHVAGATALCHFDQTIHLCIHPVLGPWIAFRAVVVLPEKEDFLDDPLLLQPAPEAISNHCIGIVAVELENEMTILINL